MLTPLQMATFNEQGVVKLARLIPRDVTGRMLDRLWAFLGAVHGRCQNDPQSWAAVDGRTNYKTLMKTGAFRELGDFVAQPNNELIGVDAWCRPEHWGHPLVTFPRPHEQWGIPATGWHVDSHAWSRPVATPGLIVLTILDEVQPRGGGTLVMLGSHHVTWRLCEQTGGFMSTKEIKSTLRDRYDWFRNLFSEASDRPLAQYFYDGDEVEGIHIRVAEVTGHPGDVIFVNPRVLHVATANVRSTPRMMLTDFVA